VEGQTALHLACGSSMDQVQETMHSGANDDVGKLLKIPSPSMTVSLSAQSDKQIVS
jgi:hypothetical protein